jgi:Ca2+-binding EF-hand superfamily protein
MASANYDRIRQHFELLDTDGDGHLEREEWEAPAWRILKAFDESGDSPKARPVITSYRDMWDYLTEQAGPGTHALTIGQFGQVAGDHIVNPRDARFSHLLRNAISAIAALCDCDAKGAVTPEGFTSWCRAVRADTRKAGEAFRQIDVDHDGDLTVDELVQAVRDYHAGTFDVSVLGG